MANHFTYKREISRASLLYIFVGKERRLETSCGLYRRATFITTFNFHIL